MIVELRRLLELRLHRLHRLLIHHRRSLLLELRLLETVEGERLLELLRGHVILSGLLIVKDSILLELLLLLELAWVLLWSLMGLSTSSSSPSLI